MKPPRIRTDAAHETHGTDVSHAPMKPMSAMQPMKPMEMRMGNMHMSMGSAPQSGSDKRFCTQCGREASTTDHFCAGCGHRIAG
jgi:hypothetical protein